MSGATAAFLGLATGLALGYSVRRARLCTFGAIEDAMEGGDYRRLKIFGLALAIAMFGTQGLILADVMSATETQLVPMRSPLLSIAIGGILFGLGMSLVGTCAFGSLVRLGSGDLRSLVVMLIFATTALATLRGILAPIRFNIIEPVAFSMPGAHPAGFVEIAEGLTGSPLRLGITVVLASALIAPVVRDRRLHKAPRLLTAGVLLGLGVLVGWIATAVLSDAFETRRIQSLTFVSPVARGLFSGILGGREWIDFSAMCALGVILGSFLSARRDREFRWEAFDDHHEMKRHLLGAALMGVGGVLAGGCTIGQGLTAGSLLAVSWPVAILCIIVGARIGIAILVEGSPRFALTDLRDKLRWPFR